MRRVMSRIALVAVAAYRVGLGPFVGGTCRFEPSCSRYAETAIERFGGVRGSWLALRRVLRCHPWGGWGIDPVPDVSSTSNRLERNDDVGTRKLSFLKADRRA